jgi:predicted AAA+ superfamily ATPase
MKKLIKLPFISTLDRNLRNYPGFLQVILGPRQVGKTTSILAYLEENHPANFHYVSADQIFNASPQWLRQQWQTARQQKLLLVIDEIQKSPNWAESIKALWDEDQRTSKIVKCVLLGSSSLEIQKGLTESLTGRFQLITAHHWNFAESNEGYQLELDDFLKFGGYPGSYPITDKASWGQYVSTSIISTVIEKDILQFNSVRNPALFRQAFEILMAYPAMEISYTKLLGQIQERGNVELVKHYIELYQGAFLLKALEKFSTNQIRLKSSSPKILPLAPCLYFLTVLDEYSPDERGRAFESVVGAQLVRTGHKLYYWREGKFEVDYVLKAGRKLWAIEVKSGRKKSSAGLDVFLKKFPGSRGIIITPDNYRQFESDPMTFLSR